jgi:hypothetical protein
MSLTDQEFYKELWSISGYDEVKKVRLDGLFIVKEDYCSKSGIFGSKL